jgi:uncharacterized protein YjbI with pentapeptide repeats
MATRPNIIVRIRKKIPDIIGKNPVLYFLLGLIVVGIVFLVLKQHETLQKKDVLGTVFGFLLDILLFGVLLSLYEEWRERRERIRRYHDELSDFLAWQGEEGLLRKAGIIRRLNDMKAGFPSLNSIVLNKADLRGVDLRGANLYAADLREVNLQGANLRGATLTLANLRGANLWEANFQGAILAYTDLQDTTHLDTNFSGAILQEAKLQGVIFLGVDFQGANLQGANFQGTTLIEADFSGANLSGANLKGADLRGSDLQGANLTEANLQGANFNGAYMFKTKNLTWMQLEQAILDEKTILPDYLKQSDPKKQSG